MTASLNRIQLIGNLGADPKSITGKDGQPFVTATLATKALEWKRVMGLCLHLHLIFDAMLWLNSKKQQH